MSRRNALNAAQAAARRLELKPSDVDLLLGLRAFTDDPNRCAVVAAAAVGVARETGEWRNVMLEIVPRLADSRRSTDADGHEIHELLSDVGVTQPPTPVLIWGVQEPRG